MLKRITVDQARPALTGPIPSLRTPFKRNGEIDYRALDRMIDFNLDAGAKTLLITYGDSLLSLLTDEEVADVMKAVVKRAKKRAMVVAADRAWWTGKSVAYAKLCREAGADVLMVLPPDWGASCTVESHTAHYAAIAKQIPVMLVTGGFIPRGAAYALKVLEGVRGKVPGVVAIKDDFCGDFARKMSLLVHDKWAVFSGGAKENHLNNHLYGCDGYLSTFITFTPRIAWDYWRAIEADDLAGAKEIIRTIDMPFFEKVLAARGGFDAAMHAIQEIAGLSGRWRRGPYASFTDGEVEDLRGFMQSRKML